MTPLMAKPMSLRMLLGLTFILTFWPTSAHGQTPSEKDAAARVQFEIGATYEAGGRLAEAEAAYLKAAADGTEQIRYAALAKLLSVIRAREAAGTEQLRLLGKTYEEAGQFADAQAVYQKALEAASPDLQPALRRDLERVVAVRNGWLETYLRPFGKRSIQSALAAVAVAMICAALFFPVRTVVRIIGRRRGKTSLQLSLSTPASQALGTAFPAVFERMHHQMEVHFRNRMFLRDRALPYLVSSQSADLVQLAGTVDPNAEKVLEWLRRQFHQPAYRVEVAIEATFRYVNAIVTLDHAGAHVARWNYTYSVSGWFSDEQDLAYEILIKLKEYVDAHAS